MRMRRWLGALLVAALALGPAAMSGAEEYEPTFVEQQAWFHPHTLPVGNLDADEGNYVQWNDEEPTAPVPSVYHGNNYGGIVDGDHTPEHFFTAEGTFTGDLDTIAFDLYFIGWAQSTVGCDLSLSFDFRVDGKWVLYQDMLGSHGIHYEEDGALVVARVALTNIWEAFEAHGIEYGPDVEHDIYVNIQNFYACNEVTWVYGSEDAPSGLTANLDDLEGYFEIDVRNPPPPIDS